MVNKVLHYGRIEKITLKVSAFDLEQLLRLSGDIPKGFDVRENDMEPAEIVLVREQLEEPAEGKDGKP
jgi:hypothetical protein